MKSIDELTQILYEISMTIGSHLDLNRMLRDVALVTLRKLNGTAYVVFEQKEEEGQVHFERVFMTPRHFMKSDAYTALEQELPPPGDAAAVGRFCGKLPMAVALDAGGCFHLMDLPDFGLVALFRAHDSLSESMIHSIARLNTKLAVACQACVSHERLQTSEMRMRLLLETMTEGMAVIDVDGMLTYVNNGMAHMLGYASPGELTGVPAVDLFDAENQSILKAHLGLRRQGDTSSYEISFMKEDKSALHALVSPQVLCDKEGNYSGSFALVTDLTSQKRAEKKLLQAEKMEAVGILAGGIAHDFNNLLGVITGNISYALSTIDPRGELAEVFSDIQQGTQQAQHLTRQLLTFARGGDPIKQPGNINRLLKEAAAFMTSGSKSRCELTLADDLWNTDIDEGQINQVFNNLVMNANQAMPDGGIIEITTANALLPAGNDVSLPAGRYIKLSIADQGIGIPETHLLKIFDPYFSTKQTGSGLGLATTYSIVGRHGGHIGVTSSVGEGTAFDIYLPASSKIVRPSVEVKPMRPVKAGRILVMDDQKQILKMAERVLVSLGYAATLASDGAQAVELYREAYQAGTSYDLVILDLTVPGGMGGEMAVAELLKIDPEVKALVSSGYSSGPLMANYEDYGFCAVMPKPYTKGQMAAVLDDVLHDA